MKTLLLAVTSLVGGRASASPSDGELGSTALTSRLKDITTCLLTIRYDASMTSLYVGTEQRCR